MCIRDRVSVDVNSGRSTRGADIEDTAFKTNLEAAEAVSYTHLDVYKRQGSGAGSVQPSVEIYLPIGRESNDARHRQVQARSPAGRAHL